MESKRLDKVLFAKGLVAMSDFAPPALKYIVEELSRSGAITHTIFGFFLLYISVDPNAPVPSVLYPDLLYYIHQEQQGKTDYRTFQELAQEEQQLWYDKSREDRDRYRRELDSYVPPAGFDRQGLSVKRGSWYDIVNNPSSTASVTVRWDAAHMIVSSSLSKFVNNFHGALFIDHSTPESHVALHDKSIRKRIKTKATKPMFEKWVEELKADMQDATWIHEHDRIDRMVVGGGEDEVDSIVSSFITCDGDRMEYWINANLDAYVILETRTEKVLIVGNYGLHPFLLCNLLEFANSDGSTAEMDTLSKESGSALLKDVLDTAHGFLYKQEH